jgi:hypothetical protein
MGSLKVGTTSIDTIGQLKLGSSNVTAIYNGSVQVFPAATTTTTSTTTTTTTPTPTTTTTTTTTTAAPTTTSTTTTTTTPTPTTSTTTTTTTAAPTTSTTTTTTTAAAIYYVIRSYDSSCNILGSGTSISNSGALNMGYFYATNELPAQIIEIIGVTSSGPDYFTNITTPGYGDCGSVPPL